MNHKQIILSLIIAPGLIAAVYFFSAPPDGKWNIHTSFLWSSAGMLLGYYGFVFSLYALLEVMTLSNRHYFKTRSPELSKQLISISRKMSEFSSEPAMEIRSQRFISEIPVTLRSAQRMKNKEVEKLAKVADSNFRKLMNGLSGGYSRTTTSSQANAYWDLHQSLSELADEITNQIKDMRAA
ncbi:MULTISPECIES: hypothetical protein [unclassified Paracoccus (in: a-proteobacteria)]|uniref:hypothetical protein n=1 Tax=unclassified Paracoccus (in: a-proteobacteria) TaxID=2688777 RepID=UPI001C082D96|nr:MULTISPECIES: hypothetical protein [unclassified Paracoccus (in: a-proteobacteria)]MBU2956794.1 hypothetical protein [Paracoccus sp. C2R09]